LRTVKLAAYRTQATFINSDGCRLSRPSGIQRLAPSAPLPTPGTSTTTSSSSTATNARGASFCQADSGIAKATAAAQKAMPSAITCRSRKWVGVTL